ncbi:MAG: amidohydrolase/deacetylase family metallohydrolase [Bryobacterales bacterium]|nr:amidohydrolase/deacetylase family metallohydrolase [Bryobacterales bacterium]
MKSTALCFLALASVALAQDYDLLLQGGHVIDAKNQISARRDVAIKDGKIAEIASSIPASKARRTVNVTGLYVTPGLVDLHVHVFAGDGREYMGPSSVSSDDHTFRAGVTTVVDAGSSGWKSFPYFKYRNIDRSQTRVLALLNIVGTGMGGGADVEQNIDDMDPKATAARVKEYRQHIVGIKTAHYAHPDWIAVDRALAAATEANVPLMVDFGRFTNERPFEQLVTEKLRPGDMYTHMYLAAVPMFDANGKVRDYLFQARKRGVLFDVGHGGGSFVFRHAAPAMKQGWTPDSISTDLHIGSMNAGMKDMLNVMSKFLNMGMSMDDVIAKSTWAPARQIKREELGNLSVGSGADIAVLSVEKGDFGFIDVFGAKMKGTQRLRAEMTLRDGRVVWDLNGLAAPEWEKLPKDYTYQGPRRQGGGGSRDRVRRTPRGF